VSVTVDVKKLEVNIAVVTNVPFSDSVNWNLDCSVSVSWTLVVGLVLEVITGVFVNIADVSFWISVNS